MPSYCISTGRYVTVVDVATRDFPVVQLLGENVIKLGGEGHLVGRSVERKGLCRHVFNIMLC